MGNRYPLGRRPVHAGVAPASRRRWSILTGAD